MKEKTSSDFNEVSISTQYSLPSTSIFATIDGELTDVINIKDSFRFLLQDEKLRIVSVVLQWCAAETSKLTDPKNNL